MSREALVRALTFLDLKEGKGSLSQLEAYRELEWRLCSKDYEYFRCNYCWIITKSGDIIPWSDPYPVNVSSAAEWAAGESTIEVKTRQIAETTNGVHFALWEAMFKDAVRWNFFGADQDASSDMKSRLDATMDRLPSWMKARAQVTVGTEGKEKRSNKQEAATIISFGLSKILIYTGSVKKAQGLAGKTLWDDAGKHTDPGRKWQLLYPTIDDPDPKSRGQVIIIFNGNGEDFLYNLYQRSKEGKTSLIPHFYSWRDDPRRLWATDSKGVGPHSVLSTRREVYPWYENAKSQYLIENPDVDEAAFRAQFPESEDEAFHISANSRFQISKLDVFSRCAKTLPQGKTGYLEREESKLTFHIHGKMGRIREYEKPVAGANYILGIDPAGGHADSDDSVIQVARLYQNDADLIASVLNRYSYLDPLHSDVFEWVETLAIVEQVAVYQAKSEPTQMANQAMRIGEYYNDALMVPEANNHGHTFIEHVKDEYPNLYREERKEKFSDEETERLGFWTNAQSKDSLIDNLAGWVHNGWFLLRDPATIQQMRMFGYQIGGGGAVRLGAPKGMNDDLVTGSGLVVVGARSMLIPRSKTPRKVYEPWQW